MDWNEIKEQSGAFKSSPREKRNNIELQLQKRVCEFIGEHYPNVYYTSDASSLGASWNTIRNVNDTKSKHAHLDLIILCPKRAVIGHGYFGLVLEFKKDSPFLQDGTLSTEKHIREQLKTMELLRSLSYRCEWIWNYDQAVGIITEYLGPSTEIDKPLF